VVRVGTGSGNVDEGVGGRLSKVDEAASRLFHRHATAPVRSAQAKDSDAPKITKISIVCQQSKLEELKIAMNNNWCQRYYRNTGSWMWYTEGYYDKISWCRIGCYPVA